MKTRSLLLLLVSILAPAALLMSGGCSKSASDKVADAVQDTKTAVKDAAVDMKNAAVDTWDQIKDFTFDKRSDFSASMDRMAAKADRKIADLKASASSATDADRQAAIKDYDEARADLKARLSELGDATADTWADAKAKVEKAWARVEAACTKATK